MEVVVVILRCRLLLRKAIVSAGDDPHFPRLVPSGAGIKHVIKLQSTYQSCYWDTFFLPRQTRN